MNLTVHSLGVPASGQSAISSPPSAAEVHRAQAVEAASPKVVEGPLTPPARPAKEGDGVYVWLDLGQVIIDTRGIIGNPSDASELSKQARARDATYALAGTPFAAGGWKLMPGAAEYIAELRAAGYKIGFITNIPEDWGTPGDYDSKIRALSTIIRERWGDPDHPPLDFGKFDSVLVPLWDRERKPADILYERALKIAGERKSVFQGETPAEIEAAKKNGMSGWLIEYDDEGRPQFLPVKDIPNHVKAGEQAQETLRYDACTRCLRPTGG